MSKAPVSIEAEIRSASPLRSFRIYCSVELRAFWLTLTASRHFQRIPRSPFEQESGPALHNTELATEAIRLARLVDRPTYRARHLRASLNSERVIRVYGGFAAFNGV